MLGINIKRTAQENLETGLPPGDVEAEKEYKKAHQPPRPMYLASTTPYTVLSTLLLCAAVVSLNAVADQNKRVGMVCAFAVLFCIEMSVCSRARRTTCA